LFALLIPVLLMLATFGLERLETGMTASDTDDEIAELILANPPRAEKPAPVPVARIAHSDADLHGYSAFAPLAALSNEPGLPTRVCRREAANPQFQPTRHANPV